MLASTLSLRAPRPPKVTRGPSPVNTLAPYLLTALIDHPDRLIYLSSGMHHTSAGSLRDIAWTRRHWNAAQAHSESKPPGNRARAHSRAGLAGRAQQRRRSGLGPDQDGRRRSNPRPGTGIPHAD